ncbi:hypothetical protein D3C76_1670390 [compost metagenome]
MNCPSNKDNGGIDESIVYSTQYSWLAVRGKFTSLRDQPSNEGTFSGSEGTI